MVLNLDDSFTICNLCYALQILIAHGANLNAATSVKETALISATEHNHLSLVAALIFKGEQTYPG